MSFTAEASNNRYVYTRFIEFDLFGRFGKDDISIQYFFERKRVKSIDPFRCNCKSRSKNFLTTY